MPPLLTPTTLGALAVAERIRFVRARRLVPFVGALLVLALPGVAASASTLPQFDINPADMSWAQSIVLTPQDLGKGWKPDPTSGDDSASNGSSGDSTWCPNGIADESDLILTGAVGSDFTRTDNSSVSSFAYVWQTPDQAQADWDRTLKVMPAQIDCLAALFTTASTHAVRAVVTAKGSLPFPAVAPRTAAYRIKIIFKSSSRGKKSKARTLSVNFDFVLLGNGRAFAEMILTSFGHKPHFPAFEQSLAAKIAGRMATDPATTPAP